MGNNTDPVQVKRTAEATHVALEASLGIADARALHAHLDAALAAGTAIVLDGGRIERLDAAAMQVLVGFCRAAHERRLTVTWKSISPSLQQAARLLGLESILYMSS
jgi:anti-anti-sigma regulatory factor